jgi:hypothetical protein
MKLIVLIVVCVVAAVACYLLAINLFPPDDRENFL